MKRNLLKGIILISAVGALSSCSTALNLSKSKTIEDDVYYTKAKAGDDFDYSAQYNNNSYQNNQYQSNYVRNDDYYYYGDYESRIARFAYATPFDYYDDFYYAYEPDYIPQPGTQVAGTKTNQTQAIDEGYYYDEPVYADLGVYDAYDFGYGNYWGYDNYGYGVAYSTFVYGGGSRANYKKSYSRSKYNSSDGLVFTRANSGPSGGANWALWRTNSNNTNASAAVDNGLVFTRANSGSANNSNIGFSGARPGGANAVYPGRPGTNAITTTAPADANVRYVRPESQNPRQVNQQPVMQRPSSPPPSMNSGSSSGSSGGSASSGGGGRPVRP